MMQQRQYQPGFPQHQPQMAPQQQQYHQQPYMQNPHSDPNKRSIQERIQSLLPPPIPCDQLNRIDTMSVPQLCQFGREIVHEISIRAMNVLSFFKLEPSRRSNPAVDIEAILTYSKQLFIRLQVIRIRVDKARAGYRSENLSETFYDEITNPEPVEQLGQSSTKQALEEQFETNRAKIIEASNKIKKLEWYSSIVDPRS